MSDRKSSGFGEIKHYMRPDARARDKRMVTEKVTEGSPTFEFLQRMEVRRTKQACLLGVDMRGKVPLECNSYHYRNRVFWMDEISYGMFLRSLKENNGVFTVGAFEAIMSGEHTFRGMQQRQTEREPSSGGLASARTPGEGEASQPAAASAADNRELHPQPRPPEVIPLGYYRDRGEPRIQWTTRVAVRADDQVFPLDTVDLSLHGLRVIAKHAVPLLVEQVVTVTFTQFNEEQAAGLTDIPYQIMGIEVGANQYRMRLRRIDDNDRRAESFIGGLVSEHMGSSQGRRKLDCEDERLTACSLLAEQYYTLSTPVIPFFVGRDGSGVVHLSAVATNENLAPLLAPFRGADGEDYDLRGLTAPHRLDSFVDACQADGQRDPLLALFYSQSAAGPRLVADFEFPSQVAWSAFVAARCREEGFRVFKVLLRPTHRPDCRKILQEIEQLSERSTSSAEDLVVQADTVEAAGGLVDITRQVHDWGVAQVVFNAELVQSALPLAEQAAELRGPAPPLVPFGYAEQRREDRYRATLAAEVEAGGNRYDGQTCDISVRGFCVQLAAVPENVNRGDVIGLTLPELHKRAKQRVKLKNIPCEVTRVERAGDGVRLCLKRSLDDRSRDVTQFVQDMIGRNAGRLAPDLTDAIAAANSRLYASMAAESAATVPLFILRDPETNDRVIKVALPREPGSFAEFFEVEPDVYDFSSAATVERISRLTGELRRSAVAEMVVYLYKRQLPDEARFEIVSAADVEFANDGERADFIAEAMLHDRCFVKVIVAGVRAPRDTEIGAVLEPLSTRSPLRASKLQEEFRHMLAAGDIVDVTREVMEAQDLGLAAARSE